MTLEEFERRLCTSGVMFQLRTMRSFGDCEDGEEQACLPMSERFDAYAWPGGYPIVYLVETFNGFHRNSGEMCPKCAEKEVRRVRWNARINLSDDRVNHYERVKTHGFIHYEGSSIFCEDCGEEIESAYGDPSEEDEVE